MDAHDEMIAANRGDAMCQCRECELARENEKLRAEVVRLSADAARYQWIMRKAKLTDAIFAFTKSKERHVSNAIDDAITAADITGG